MVQQIPILHLCLYWPKFYLSLFKHKNNIRSIWEIIVNPVQLEGSCRRGGGGGGREVVESGAGIDGPRYAGTETGDAQVGE